MAITRIKPDAATTAAFAAARIVTRHRYPDLYRAAFFLPPAKRKSAHALAAFCSLILDALTVPDPLAMQSGCCSGGGGGNDLLPLIRERIDEMYQGALELPLPGFRDESQHVLHAAQVTLNRYDVPKALFTQLLDGLAADARVSRYATWSSVRRHCHDVAGSLVLLASCVLGVTTSDSRPRLLELATALRLTDILRNLNRDYARGKLYLPIEDLTRFRYSERDLANHTINDSFHALIEFETHRARNLYRTGAEVIAHLAGEGARLAASSIILHRAANLDGRTKAPLRRMADAWRLARRRPGETMPDLFKPRPRR